MVVVKPERVFPKLINRFDRDVRSGAYTPLVSATLFDLIVTCSMCSGYATGEYFFLVDSATLADTFGVEFPKPIDLGPAFGHDWRSAARSAASSRSTACHFLVEESLVSVSAGHVEPGEMQLRGEVALEGLGAETVGELGEAGHEVVTEIDPVSCHDPACCGPASEVFSKTLLGSLRGLAYVDPAVIGSVESDDVAAVLGCGESRCSGVGCGERVVTPAFDCPSAAGRKAGRRDSCTARGTDDCEMLDNVALLLLVDNGEQFRGRCLALRARKLGRADRMPARGPPRIGN
jgi:hypothetical protein